MAVIDLRKYFKQVRNQIYIKNKRILGGHAPIPQRRAARDDVFMTRSAHMRTCYTFSSLPMKDKLAHMPSR